MEFFRNFADGAAEQIPMSESSHPQQSTPNSSSFNDNVASRKEITEPTHGRIAGEDGGGDSRIGNTQPPMRGMSMEGKWGSTFLKDCDPRLRGASDSGDESKSGSYKGSEGEESDGAEDRLASGNERKGHQIVPEDDMLSDEYYEQDGNDQIESLKNHRAVNNSSGYSLKPPSRPTAPKNVSRKTKALKRNKYDDEDVDYEESDEEEDEDDPDDADFDPDIGATSGHRGVKDKDEDWDAEESDEEDNIDDEDLDISDEDDTSFKKNRAKLSVRTGRNVKSSRQLKSVASSTRQKKGRTYFDEYEELSLPEDSASDEDFRRTRIGASIQRKNGGRSASVSVSHRNNELRTSGRSVRKVSYVESDESEDLDEGKKRNLKKEEIEEEDSDTIEKVLWHQPKGTADEAVRNNKSTEPMLLSYLYDSEPDWNETEFLIKWKGQSHLHCSWKSFSELQNWF